ncbi:DUF2442 domain-containing protein [Luteibacter yeojuensis]|nr:DUF2442 domain-containing protein [Luteibacter yeojuensis]
MSRLPPPQFTLRAVRAVQPNALALEFDDGFSARVDLAPVIRRYKALSPLRDWTVFSGVALGASGRSVVFTDEIDLASDNLRARALEQLGHYTHEHVIVWMEHHDLTLDQAADALGLSRRMLAYYRSGEKLVPRTVGLAMVGWDHLHARTAA